MPGAPLPGLQGYQPGTEAQAPGYPPFGPGRGFPGMGQYGGTQAPMQISRQSTEDAYIIEIQLADMTPEELQISTRGNWISIGKDQSRQEIKEDTFDQGRGYARSYSFSTGSASRRFSLPGDADMEAMSREEGEGVVRLVIPRRRY
jgi:HSP20 family molecular chaperone IbpA